MPYSQRLDLLILAGVAVLAGCEATAPARTGAPASKASTRVEVVRPEKATVRRTVDEPGQVESLELTPLHAKVAGYVESWSVDIGASLKKGQVLAVLSVPELDAEAAQKEAMVLESEAKLELARAAAAVAEANLSTARAKLEETAAGVKRAEADLERWQAEARRVEQLFTERALTGTLLDETRSKLHAAEAARGEIAAQVHTAEAGVKQGEALLRRAKAEVTAATASTKVAALDVRRVEVLRGFARIVAPYDGYVVRRTVQVGQLTDPAPKGEPLFVVSRSDRVRVVVGVPEMHAAAVHDGDRVLVRVQSLKGRTFEGKVSRNAWSLDTANRTLRVEADLTDPEGLLRPGLYVNASIVVEEHANVATIPTTAVIRDGTNAACVVVRDGKATRQPITTGLDDGTRTEILTGLRDDDSVVKAGGAALSNGQAVDAGPPRT